MYTIPFCSFVVLSFCDVRQFDFYLFLLLNFCRVERDQWFVALVLLAEGDNRDFSFMSKGIFPSLMPVVLPPEKASVSLDLNNACLHQKVAAEAKVMFLLIYAYVTNLLAFTWNVTFT